MPAPVQDLGAARKYLEKQFGDGAVMNLTGAIEMHKCIKTGHPFVDYVFGGGVPYGKMVEVFGRPSSGKTTLSLLAAAQAQRQKNKTGRVLWLDYEHAFDVRYFKRLGGLIDEDHFQISQPTTAEEGFEIARVFMNRNLVDLVVFDSVAAMMSFKESGSWVDSKGDITEDGKGKQMGGMGEQQIGLHARVITQGIKQLNSMLGASEVAMIFINQIRTKIATKKGQQTTEETTGGHAIKFYSAARIEMQRVKSKMGKLYDPIENKVLDGQIVAIETRVKGAKNRVAPPFRQAIVTVTFGQGFDTESDLLRMATNHNLVEKGGTGWYKTESIGASRNARGEADFKKLMKEEPQVYQALMIKVTEKLDTLDDIGMVVVEQDEADLETADKILSTKPTFAGTPKQPITPPASIVPEKAEKLTLVEGPTITREVEQEDEELTAMLDGEADPKKGEAPTTMSVVTSPKMAKAETFSLIEGFPSDNLAIEAINSIPDPQ